MWRDKCGMWNDTRYMLHGTWEMIPMQLEMWNDTWHMMHDKWNFIHVKCTYQQWTMKYEVGSFNKSNPILRVKANKSKFFGMGAVCSIRGFLKKKSYVYGSVETFCTWRGCAPKLPGGASPPALDAGASEPRCKRRFWIYRRMLYLHSKSAFKSVSNGVLEI